MATRETVLSGLKRLRDPVAEYQEPQGIPRDERITFVSLITALCKHTYDAGSQIVCMIYKILPIFEGFLYFIRFILDKLIDIIDAETTKDKVLKSVLFFGQLVIIAAFIYLMWVLILLPIILLTFNMAGRIIILVRRSNK